MAEYTDSAFVEYSDAFQHMNGAHSIVTYGAEAVANGFTTRIVACPTLDIIVENLDCLVPLIIVISHF